MPILGAPRTFHDGFNFLMEIGGFASAAFQKMSELSVEVATIAYSEGGALIPNKSPGRMTFPPVTLERGASFDLDMLNWFEEVADASSLGSLTSGAGQGVGLIEPLYKRDIDLIQQDRNGTDELRRWRLFGAWPRRFVAGEWDNEADEKTIEMLELEYDFFVLAT